MKVSIQELKDYAKNVGEALEEETGINVSMKPHFAYGMYSYYVEIGSHQYFTGFGTKQECYQQLRSKFYEICYDYSKGYITKGKV